MIDTARNQQSGAESDRSQQIAAEREEAVRIAGELKRDMLREAAGAFSSFGEEMIKRAEADVPKPRKTPDAEKCGDAKVVPNT